MPQNVDIRTLAELPDLQEACELFVRVWRSGPATPAMTADILRALTLVGNYAAGAYVDGELVGASVGFFAEPDRRSLHSHVTGVSGRTRGLGVGLALKRHQREWALERGVAHVSWTFDPLVGRNAHVNLTKLGATAVEYLPNLYGRMDDGINAGDESDRLLVSWQLDSPRVVAALAGAPVTSDVAGAGSALAVDAAGRPEMGDAQGERVLVGVPTDVEALRVRDPALATQWRLAVRSVLGGLLSSGARVVGFAQPGGYQVRRAERQESHVQGDGRPGTGFPDSREGKGAGG